MTIFDTHCPLCGGPHDEKYLGPLFRKRCNTCGQCSFLTHDFNICTHCSSNDLIPAEFTIPAGTPCNSCLQFTHELRRELLETHIYWICEKCSSEGHIARSSPIGKQINGEGLSLKSCPFCEA